ncbi:Peptidase M23 [Gloeocapsa sp. PCC 7428]|nr:Peptidase M23 [Gloeocapsa sp. PCC 7428]
MKKVKAVPASAKSKAAVEEQLKPVQPKVKRRVRTSVAMMAIAISMGGPNLLLTRHDRTPAAEIPQGEEPAAIPVSTTTSSTQAASIVVEVAPAPATTSVTPASPPSPDTVQINTTQQTTPIRVEQEQRQKPTLAMDASPKKYTAPKAVAPRRVETTTNDSTQISTSKVRAAQRQDRLVQQLKSANKVDALNKSSGVPLDASTQPVSSRNNQQQEPTAPAATKQKLLVNRLKQQSNHSKNSSAELRSEEFNTRTAIQATPQSPSTVVTQPSNLLVTPYVETARREASTNNSTSELNQPVATAPQQPSYESNQNQLVQRLRTAQRPMRSQPESTRNQNVIVETQVPSVAINPPQISTPSLDPLNKITSPTVIGTQVTPTEDVRDNSVVVDIKESLATPLAVTPDASQQQVQAEIVDGQQQIDRTQLPMTSVEFGIANVPYTIPSPTQDAATQEAETTTPQTAENQSIIAERTQPKTLEPETVFVISEVPEDTNKASVQVASLATEYQVKPGDTLTAIARAHDVALDELVSANQIANPDQLQINQSITIPTSVYHGAVAQNIDVSDRPQQQNRATISAQPHVSIIPDSREASAATFVAYNNPSTNTAVQEPTVATLGVGGSLSNEEPLDPPNLYVQGLQAEIQQLRQKYNTPTANSAEQTVEAPIKVNTKLTATPAKPKSVASVVTQTRSRKVASEPVNPEFRVAQANTSGSGTIKARLATAPTNVDPTEALQSLRGRQVSPELPPLGAADMYLPKPGSSAPFTGYIWPAKGVLSSGYGWRWGRMHRGIDVAAPVGTPIFAAASGVIVRAGWNSGGYGNLVDIRHPDGSLTRYAHNNRILVRAGQEVEQGQHIAEMGSTGFSTGPHLHFEVHPAGKGAVNPIALLPRRR